MSGYKSDFLITGHAHIRDTLYHSSIYFALSVFLPISLKKLYIIRATNILHYLHIIFTHNIYPHIVPTHNIHTQYLHTIPTPHHTHTIQTAHICTQYICMF